MPAASSISTTDVIVNNPATDTAPHTTQFEPSMAVRGTTICAGYVDTGPGASAGLSRSTNGGATWTDQGSINAFGFFPDPSLAVHQASGTFYYAEITTLPGGGGGHAIGVARSTDNCTTFGAPVDASPASSGLANTVLSDKPWMAVDNSGGARDGDIYVCWTRVFTVATVNNFELRFSRSTDGGATYTNEQVLVPAGARPFACSVAVGSNGEVNVAWADRAAPNGIFFRRSTDGGVMFTPTVTVSAANRTPGSDRVVACPQPADPTRTDFTLNGDIRQLHQAWMAVDATGGPFNGNIYVVWASDPVGATDNSDVFFSRSTNGGLTWDPAVQIGAGGGATDQFEPNLAVGGDEGAVSIAWFDRRNDTANNMLIDVYKTFSRTGGATFDPIIRVTDQSFGVPPLNPNFDTFGSNCALGEYLSVTADAGSFYYMWTDNRNTVGTRLDPDIFFESEAAPDQPISASGVTFNAVEGATFTGQVATFTDPDTTATADEYSATIDWGDSTPPSAGTITGSGGSFSVSGSHTYEEEGTYTVTVKITDVDNSSNTATANSTAKVADAALFSTCTAPATASNPFNGNVARFTDADPHGTVSDYTATINWGDSSSSSGTVSGPNGGPFDVSGSHTYSTTGFFTISVKIDDAGGSTTSTSCQVLIFAFAPGGGAFVIGDQNSAVNTNVTFWGAQWSKLNGLSGGAAPSSFKGFAKNPTSPACGTGWSTDPGNSAPPPPGPLPAYMGMLVTSSATKSGSQISGNTPHIVVVKTNPGYAPDPGHAGTGKVVAQNCSTA